MIQNIRCYLRRSPRITVVLGLVLVIGTRAYADVVGRLHFTVKNAANDKVVVKASLVVTDPAGLVLALQNVFDDRTVLNFNSVFIRTRFQEGRRILLIMNG